MRLPTTRETSLRRWRKLPSPRDCPFATHLSRSRDDAAGPSFACELQRPAFQGGNPMKKWIVAGAASGAALAGLLATGTASAASKQVDQITCEEFLALKPDDQNRIAYWVDGYAQAKGEAAVGTVALDKFGQPIGALVEDCKKTPKETLWQKMKKYL